MRDSTEYWYEGGEDDDPKSRAAKIHEYVERMETEYSWLFLRYHRLNWLYDPLYEQYYGDDDTGANHRRSESVIASSVDTVTGIIATSEIRPRVLVDNGDWSEHRRAAKLSWYGEAIAKQIDAHGLAVSGFKSGAHKGTGLAKVCARKGSDRVWAEQVLVEDLIVPDTECRAGAMPRQMHHRIFIERQEAKRKVESGEYGRIEDMDEALDAIEKAEGGSRAQWAGYRPFADEQIVLIESWHLPTGKKGTDNYKPGRHCITVGGECCLVDEPYHKAHFPIAVFFWTRRDTGFYGIGGGERIAGQQEHLDQLNHQIRRQQYKLANPTTWVHISDANIQAQTRKRFGDIALYKQFKPETVIPPAVSNETYQERERTRDHAYEEFGVTRLHATGKKPGRIDSGAGMREYVSATTQRFAPQEKGFERFVLDIIWLALDACKDIAAEGMEPPVVVKKLAKGRRKLKWKDVDTDIVRLQMQAAATLSRTPAGRTDMVLEWAQAGLISVDESRQMLAPFDPLDTANVMSLYSAALDNADLAIEEILEGEQIVPNPFMNLKICAWRAQQKYLQVQGEDAPDAVLEALRQFAIQAAYILALGSEEQQALAGAQPANQTPTTSVAPQAKQIAGIG